MKRTFLAALAVAAGAALAVPAAASAQSTATVSLMHGIPGATVDVVVDGAVVVPGFQPGTMQDISSFAGQTLRNVEVRAAGTTRRDRPDRRAGRAELGQLDRPRPPDADGTPTITPFENDIVTVAGRPGSTDRAPHGRRPAVDIVLADGARPFTNLSNPNEASAALPAGQIAGAQVAPAGGDPLAPIPTVELAAGTDLIVYAVGSLEGGSFTFYTQVISGLGGGPLVPTGDGLPGRRPNAALVLAALAGALAAGRHWRPRHPPDQGLTRASR